MHENKQEIDPQSLKEGWERSDVQTGLAWVGFVGIGLLMAGAIVTILLIVRGYDASLVKAEVSPIVQSDAFSELEGPLLQSDPVKAKHELLAEGTAHLESAGVVEGAEGKLAYIPIERAIELVASKEVPYRQEATVALTTDTPAE